MEDAYGPLRYLVFYFADGFAAMMAQTGMTLWSGTGADARVPNLGGRGAPCQDRRVSFLRSVQGDLIALRDARVACLARACLARACLAAA